MSRRRFLGEVSWLQVAASALAAVTAAFIASRLGVAGTLIGAALGSFVVTISSAFYNSTLHHGRTLLIQTEHGTVIERHVEPGETQQALDEAAEIDSPARSAQFVDDKPSLHWKTIFITTAVVLALALASITAYELIAGHTFDGSGGTTIGDSLGGDRGKPTPRPSTIDTPPATTPTPSTPATTTPATTPTVTVPTTPTPTPTTATPTTP